MVFPSIETTNRNSKETRPSQRFVYISRSGPTGTYIGTLAQRTRKKKTQGTPHSKGKV